VDDRAELDTTVIRGALLADDYLTVIREVRAAMQADPVAAVQDPVIGAWLGRRYRDIFLQEAIADPAAVKHSQATFPLSLLDRRSQRERVGRRMFRHPDAAELAAEMPPAEVGPMGNTTIVFAPGLLTGLLPVLAFQAVWPQITRRFGVPVIAVDAHPMRSSEANVADLENAIERGIGVAPDIDGSYITAADHPTPPGQVLLIGYSKGSPDILTLLHRRPDLAPRITGFIGWAGAIGGSYAADDIYEKVKDIKEFDVVRDMQGRIGQLMLRLAPVIQVQRVNRRLDEYDIKGALKSLTTWYRGGFMDDNRDELAELGIPMFYFSGSTTIFEVPWFELQGTWDLKQHDRDNDMQLTQQQARPPMATAPHLAMFSANHWDLSYDTFPWYATLGSTHLKDPFARLAAMSAIVLFMSELGLLT
jgi:hypothetical protein